MGGASDLPSLVPKGAHWIDASCSPRRNTACHERCRDEGADGQREGERIVVPYPEQ